MYLKGCAQKTSAVRGVCPVRKFCGQGGSSDADVRNFWGQNFEFFEIYGVSGRTMGLNQCQHFVDKEEGGQSFGILSGRILWTAPNVYKI